MRTTTPLLAAGLLIKGLSRNYAKGASVLQKKWEIKKD
jgi:hypothetical protein